jgi:CheY-like chemotaxis protein
MKHIRVLVALPSPMARMRLRGLAREDGIEVVAEATSGAEAADRALDLQPDIVLCDQRIADEAAMVAFYQHGMDGGACHLVLLMSDPHTARLGRQIRVAATLAQDLPISQLADHLREVAATRKQSKGIKPAAPLPGMAHRFSIGGSSAATFAGPLDRVERMVIPSGEESGVPECARPLSATTQLTTRNLGRPSRRHRSETLDRLHARLSAMQAEQLGQRDIVTGLPNLRVLGQSLQALTTVSCPAAVMVVHLWRAPVPASDADLAALMRSVGAALLSNVRLDDVICRLDGPTFAIVLPGLEQGAEQEPMNRIVAALDRSRELQSSDLAGWELAAGLGFWQPLMQPEEPLATAWAAMLSQRQRRQNEQEAGS